MKRVLWWSMYMVSLILVMSVFSVTYAYPGCDDPTANNYDANATSNNNSCVYCTISQIFDAPAACCDDLDASGICDYDEICIYPIAHGCTNPLACNYAPDAVVDVGNCIICGPGHACNTNNFSCCEDPDNNNVCGDQGAGGGGSGDGDGDSIGGCVSNTACNYNPKATYDNGSCIFAVGCTSRCPGDPGSPAYLDACGVCDSNLNNDNTTCVTDCPYTPGDSCDDGNIDTENDMWDNACICVGTPIIILPEDCKGIPGGSDIPGSSCDDGDVDTENDVWDRGCVCAGDIIPLPLDCLDVEGGPDVPGASCDDGDSQTINDTWNGACMCAGTIITIGSDCLGVEGGPDMPGSDCNDGDAKTINDTWNGACDCAGTMVTEGVDCVGELGGTALPGSTCNDNNNQTENDMWNTSCDCIGVVPLPLDCKDIPGGPNLPGTTCNDGENQTENDMWNESCACVGEFLGPVDCNGEIGGTALPGSSCDDIDSDTENDVWNDVCVCAGESIFVIVGDEEERYPYPVVEGAIYLEIDDPLVSEDFEDIIEKFGIDDMYQPFDNLDIFTYRIEFDPSLAHEDLIAALQNKFGDSIQFAEPIPLVQLNLAWGATTRIQEQILPAYLSAIGYDRLIEHCSYLFDTQSRKIRVAIIDNGFQPHEDLDEHVVYTYDAADRDDDVYITDTNESCAHGNIDAGLVGAVSTNNLGIISAGYNPELVLLKATPDGRPCTDITAGIEALAKSADHADVVNVSWGVSFDSKVLKKVVDKMLERNIIIVAAAGNFNTSKPFYPAAYPGVIAVGSVDDDNNRAHFSNYGMWVDIAAPGIDMLSTGLENGYTKVSGTSQSSPLVAGWLAFLLSQGASPEDLYTYITPIQETNIGVGVIDAAGFCTEACQVDYSTVDYTDDGQVDEQDVRLLKNRIADEFVTLGCVDNFDPVRCCPGDKICDMNNDLKFDTEDLNMFQDIIEGYIYHDILGDGIDNDCDGLVDDEHGAAPVAHTASFTNSRWYIVLIILILLLGFLGRYIWSKRIDLLRE